MQTARNFIFSKRLTVFTPLSNVDDYTHNLLFLIGLVRHKEVIPPLVLGDIETGSNELILILIMRRTTITLIFH